MAVTTLAEQSPSVPEPSRTVPRPYAAPPPDATTPSAQVRRTELGTFLRNRRERLSPQDVGLPPGPRRRTPGLRREEVAQLAGVGVTWYTWLEQGRPINASTQVLDSIARTLRLGPDEHSHLYRLADVPSLAPVSRASVALEPGVQAVLDELHSIACVMSERFDILAWNRTYERVFPAVTTLAANHRNALWNTFAAPGCCHPYVNREEEMPRMVATLRGAYAHHVGEPYWEHFIKDLQENSAQFAQLWARHEVGGYASRVKIFEHPAVGRLQFRTLSMGIHASPGARMVILRSADEETAAAVRAIEEGSVVFEESVYPCGHSFRGMAASVE